MQNSDEALPSMSPAGRGESKREAMNRNWSNQKANPALKTKREINNFTNKQNTIRKNC